MKNIVKRYSAFFLVLCLLMLSACGTSVPAPPDGAAAPASATGGTAGEDVFTVGFSNLADIYPFCLRVSNEVRAAGEAAGMRVIITNANGDVMTQNADIENFIVQGCDVVMTIPIDPDGALTGVEAAVAAGIPYISICSGTRYEGDNYIFVSSEHYVSGQMQGEYLCEVLPENAKLLYLTGDLNELQGTARKEGLLDGLSARPDIEIIAEQNSENAKDKGMSIMEDWLQVYGDDDFAGVVCQNDDSALGAIEAMKGANRLNGKIIVGIDGSADAVDAIAAGEMTMSIFQDAEGQAQAAIEVCKQIRDGTNPNDIEDVMVPFATITMDNVKEFQ